MSDESPIVLPDDPSFGDEVQVDYPGYRSTRLRAPKRPLVTLPEELHPAAGPVFGEETVVRARLRPDAAARRRAARRADHRRRPRARRGRQARSQRARRGLAGQCGGPLQARGRPAPCAARPELLGRRALPHRRRGQLPLHHGQAGRVPLGEPRERLASGAHPFLGLRPGVHPAARHADVLPGRSAVPVRPDLQLGPRPEGAGAAHLRVRSRDARSPTGRSRFAGTSCSAAAAAARRRSRRHA